MAFVRTFAIYDDRGVPDRLVREFLSECEKKGPIRVHTEFINKKSGMLLTVFATLTDTWDSMEIDPATISSPIVSRRAAEGTDGDGEQDEP